MILYWPSGHPPPFLLYLMLVCVFQNQTLKSYADMHHSLLGGEKDANVEKVREDLLHWLVERTEDTQDLSVPDATAP